MRFCSALTSEKYNPCFQRERRDLAKPSGVRGPVLAPPCIRHRPLRIAEALHGVPWRVLALHLGAEFGSPGRFPFLSQPLRESSGTSSIVLVVMFGRGLFSAAMFHRANDHLAAFIDVYVPNDRLLADFSSIAVQSASIWEVKVRSSLTARCTFASIASGV